MSAAPGAPGLPPTWCSSAKEMVGCSLGSSRLWFTIGGGIVNEVYYPRVDLPQIRDLGFIVSLLAVGATREARNALRYLIATQNEDGHWHQNQWLDGKGYWLGVQLDETAFPVLLAVALDERGALDGTEVARSEERRVGEEGRSRGSPDHLKKKKK